MPEATTQLDFSNTKVAYRAKTKQDLERAKLLYRVLQNPILGGPGQAIMRWSVKWGLPVKPIIKATLYRQFIGGETRGECQALAKSLHQYNVQTVLDYAAEGEESDSAFKQNLEEFKQNIDLAADEASIPLSVFKPSAIARDQDLTNLSRKTPDHWTEQEQQAYEQILSRFHEIFSKAYERQVPVMIDAEESWTQAVVDDLALTMMSHYNQDYPLVLNTYQLYRKDRLQVLKDHHKKAQSKGVYFGGKLVRGAYLEKERQVAKDEGRPSPVHETKEATDTDFNNALAFCISHISSCAIMIATHNEASVQKAIQYMDREQLRSDHPHIWFSQLYGMADHISFNLAEKGYQTTKYTPYGPVEAVVPYLIRRAEENSSVQGQVKKELDAIEQELKRRKNGKA